MDVEVKKRKSLLDFPNNYIIIDLETTGLSSIYDSIIEITAIRYVNHNPVDNFSTLIKIDEELDSYITELTGITNEMLINKGMDITEAMNILRQFINNDDILIGHNLNFDLKFLDKYIALPNDYIDTLRLSRKILKNLKHHRLIDVANYYNVDCTDNHRAEKDCMITNSILIELEKDVLSQYDSLDTFKKENNIAKKHYSYDIDSIKPIDTDSIDIDNPIYNKSVCFTGTLEKMTRKEALQLVVNLGGIATDSVTKDTNLLVLGNNDYCKTIKGGKSSKQKKAENYKLKGYDIEILPEHVFYEMLKLD